MKIYELLSRLSETEVSMQGLNGAITSIKSTKQRGVSAVTFHTDGLSPGDLVQNDGKVAIVIFVDRKAWERESAADAKAPGSAQDREDVAAAALRELVRLKDIKDRMDRNQTVTVLEAEDYRRNKPKAWERARTVVVARATKERT